MTQIAQHIIDELQISATPARRAANIRFFKTAPGEYGAGDRFLGVAVPDVRRVVHRMWRECDDATIGMLLASCFHEVRLCGALILVQRARCARDTTTLRAVYDLYMTHLDRINNWDLVDTSAPDIVGRCLCTGIISRNALMRLARSTVVWHRRVAIIATFARIREGSFADTFAVAQTLLGDTHDLIHKALGWMLREVWKRDAHSAEQFIATHYSMLSRTTLRYAIERMPLSRRCAWLQAPFLT